MEADAESQRANHSGRDVTLARDLGFQYFKLTQDRADAAWEKIHTITRWNYAALGAASVVLSAKFSDTADQVALLPALGVFVIAASVAASVLAWMHLNYSLYLFEYAYQREKDWLRNKPKLAMLEKIHNLRKSPKNKKSTEWPLGKEELVEMTSSIHFWTNMLPALIATLAWMSLR